MTTPATGSLTRPQLVALASGNVIEYYDYLIYGLLTPVISTLFFPAADRATSLLQTFAAFATTMLARPIGALVMGIIGDLTDRKNTLLLSSLLTGLSTMSIGFLPDTASIGTTATVLLVSMRFLQGLGMSPEFCSVIIISGEMAAPGKRGFTTSLAHSSGALGTLLASVIVTLVFLLPQEDIYRWGWRIPFWLGGFICLSAWIIRKHMPEQKQAGNIRRLGVQLLKNRIALTRIFFVIAGNSTLYYLLFVFFSTYLTEVSKISADRSMLINSSSLIVLILSCLLGGMLGDRYGKKRIYLGSILFMAAMVTPVFWIISQGNSWHCLAGQTLLAVLSGIIMGSSGSFYTEMLPADIRMTGTAVPYSMAILLFGGTAPLIAFNLIEFTGFSWSPGLYLSGLCLIITASLYGYKEQQPVT